MKNAKKILSVMLAFMLTFGICSCSKEVNHLEPRDDLFESITLGMTKTEFFETKRSLQSERECPTSDVYKSRFYETLVDDETVIIRNDYVFDPENKVVGLAGYYKLKKGDTPLTEEEITQSLELSKDKFYKALDKLYGISKYEEVIIPAYNGTDLQEYGDRIQHLHGINHNEFGTMMLKDLPIGLSCNTGEYTVSLFGGPYKENDPNEIYFYVSVTENKFAEYFYYVSTAWYQ